MTTVWLALGADVRRRWRALLSLAVLLGLIGGVVLAAAAGARRTHTAYPRLLQWARASQVAIIPQGSGLSPARTLTGSYYAALARLPQVAAMTTGVLNTLVGPAMAAVEHLKPGDTLRLTAIPNDPKTGLPDFKKAVPPAILAVGTLAHVLLTSVRRRGRDLALLKTLGFTRSQVLRLVAWQACAFAALALLIGLPLGIVAGRWAWAVFADSVGVGTQPDVPLTLILLSVPVTLALATFIAAWPGWRAARVRPARVLRTE